MPAKPHVRTIPTKSALAATARDILRRADLVGTRASRRRGDTGVLGIGSATLDRLIAEGRFPEPTVRLARPRFVGWHRSIVDRWLASHFGEAK